VAHPRRIVPGETYLVTRRCYQRTFRRRPRDETNQIFMYCLAFAMQKTGVLLHAACVMSNHHHLVVTDPQGLLPEFLRELHRLTAKAINASQGQWENLWAAEPCNVVRLVTDDDVEDKIAYVAANPVAAGLVDDPTAWPGFLAWGEQQFRVARPVVYFHEDGICPPELTLRGEAAPPCDLERKSSAERLRHVREAVAKKVTHARDDVRASGRTFLGAAVVLSTSFVRRARSYEERRGVIPTFAARLKSVRDQLRRVERGFRAGYRRALGTWRKGVRTVVFPYGTWGMRVLHAAAVESMGGG
jgi:REP element-mobilizing transposase RayT